MDVPGIRWRVGHVHVPKTAGTAINTALFEALGAPEFHLLKVADPDETDHFWPGRTLHRGSAGYDAVRACPFVAGHLSITVMRELARNFLFVVLRDPASRLLSNYAFERNRARRAIAGGADFASIHPRDADALRGGPADYARTHRHLLSAAKLLGRDEGFYEPLERERQPTIEQIRDLMGRLADERVSLLDRVYYEVPAQEVVDEVCGLWGLVPTAVRRENVTPDIRVPSTDSDDLADALADVCLADYVLVDLMLPGRGVLAGMDAAITDAIERFQTRYDVE